MLFSGLGLFSYLLIAISLNSQSTQHSTYNLWRNAVITLMCYYIRSLRAYYLYLFEWADKRWCMKKKTGSPSPLFIHFWVFGVYFDFLPFFEHLLFIQTSKPQHCAWDRYVCEPQPVPHHRVPNAFGTFDIQIWNKENHSPLSRYIILATVFYGIHKNNRHPAHP